MSDALTTKVDDILLPGQAALIEGLGVEADATSSLTAMVGQVLAGQQAVLASNAALAAQIAAQHTEMLAAIAPLVMRDAGL